MRNEIRAHVDGDGLAGDDEQLVLLVVNDVLGVAAVLRRGLGHLEDVAGVPAGERVGGLVGVVEVLEGLGLLGPQVLQVFGGNDALDLRGLLRRAGELNDGLGAPHQVVEVRQDLRPLGAVDG
eukprot:3143997-Alexandrium_andersonii.AAC.1